MGEVVELMTPATVFRDSLKAGLPVEEALADVAKAFPQIPWPQLRVLVDVEPLVDAQQLRDDERAEYEAAKPLYNYGVAE